MQRDDIGGLCFAPDEVSVLSAADQDAYAKLVAPPGRVGRSRRTRQPDHSLCSLRARLGKPVVGHAVIKLLSFLARQTLGGTR
jgi:hypothetical protein